MENEKFGAKALVYLKYAGELKELAKLLGDKMEIPDIWFDSDIDSPHEITAMSEFCGFQLWLNKSNSVEGFDFEIEIETTMDVKDRFEKELFDLSPWLAKEIFNRCKIETYC